MGVSPQRPGVPAALEVEQHPPPALQGLRTTAKINSKKKRDTCAPLS